MSIGLKICVWTFVLVAIIACGSIDYAVARHWLIPGIENSETTKIVLSSIVIGVTNIIIIIIAAIIIKRLHRKFHPERYEIEMHRPGHVPLDT